MDRYQWPGNVRELRNVVERTMVLYGKERQILSRHLPAELREPGQVRFAPVAGSLEDMVSRYERGIIEDALASCGGVQTRAADLLGTTRRILGYRIKRLGIPASAEAG
jgi:DNA-binding NtrC family response regulator